MKYVKAEEILPEYLLKEIQKYVCGEMIYVPSPEGTRRGWGVNSGSRAYLNTRNSEIKSKFHDGLTIDQLTSLFCLSTDSIKKIVYSK
jgi:Mor family transcriptional regulator